MRGRVFESHQVFFSSAAFFFSEQLDITVTCSCSNLTSGFSFQSAFSLLISRRRIMKRFDFFSNKKIYAISHSPLLLEPATFHLTTFFSRFYSLLVGSSVGSLDSEFGVVDKKKLRCGYFTFERRVYWIFGTSAAWILDIWGSKYPPPRPTKQLHFHFAFLIFFFARSKHVQGLMHQSFKQCF